MESCEFSINRGAGLSSMKFVAVDDERRVTRSIVAGG